MGDQVDAPRPNVGEGLQTLAQNHRRGLKTPTYKTHYRGPPLKWLLFATPPPNR